MWPLTGAQGLVEGPGADLCKDRPRESSWVGGAGGVFIKQRKQRIKTGCYKSH